MTDVSEFLASEEIMEALSERQWLRLQQLLKVYAISDVDPLLELTSVDVEVLELSDLP